MGKKDKKRTASDDEDKENRWRRKIRRLEEKLQREQEKQRKHSSYFREQSRRPESRATSRRSWSRASSRRSWSRASSRQSQYRASYSPTQSRAWASPRRSRSRDRSRSRSSRRRSRSLCLQDESQVVRPSISRKTTPSVQTVLGPTVEKAPDQVGRIERGSQPEVGREEVPEHEIELRQEVLSVIGARLEPDKEMAAAVHKDVALRWAEILQKGLPADEIKGLIKKYPIPENCTFITVPKLNAEIIAAVQENAVKRDKRIVEKQERIASGLAAVGKAISIALKIEDSQKLELLEILSDGGRLLASVHREESLARKSLVLLNLNSSMKSTLSNTSVDEWLFGTDLEEKIKVAKNLERTTKDLKPPAKPSQQKQKTKNSRGPPRQSSYKRQEGTSGGQKQSSSNSAETKKPYYRKEPARQYGKRR